MSIVYEFLMVIKNMKKNILSMMAGALLVVGLAACGGYDQHPFKDISEVYLNAAQEVIDNPSIAEDEDWGKNLEEKKNSLAKDLYGKTILTEISDGLGFEVVSNEGNIGEGDINGDNLHIPINIDLKVTDPALAKENILYDDFLHLIAYFYDEEGTAVYACTLGDEQKLKKESDSDDQLELIELVDTIAKLDTTQVGGAGPSDNDSPNPYKVGQILHKGFRIGIEFSEIQPFVNISKIVIEKYDEAKSEAIEARNREQEKEFIRKMREAVK